MRINLLIIIFFIFLNACSASQNDESEFITPTQHENETQEPNLSPKEITSPSPTIALTNTANPTDTPAPSPTPLPDYQDSIVFVSDRDGDNDIYLMDSDGGNVTRLTENNDDDSSPRWSHDKNRILFLSRIIPNTHLFVMNPDGSALMNLTPDLFGISQCEWSPTTQQIACLSVQEEWSGNDLILIDPDNQNVSTAYTGEANIFDLAWSPDGEKIAMALAETDGLMIYSLHVDSIQEYILGDGFSQQVAWSNNGNRLAYSFGPAIQGDFATIYTVKADGSNPKRWVEIGGPEWVQSFSPTDEYVLVESARDGLFEIFLFDLETKELIQLTDDELEDTRSISVNYSPVYSEDGSKIVFVSLRDGNSEIYVMDADGSNQTNLTNNPARDWNSDW